MTPDDALPPDDLSSGDLSSGDLSRSVPEPDDTIDGYSVDRLSDYLDSGRTPVDPGIERSAACRLYLLALEQVHDLSRASLEQEARREPDRDGLWITGLLDSIKAEVVGGRDIPVRHPDATVKLSITEAAARGLVRRTGDRLDGIVLGSTTFDGDLGTPDAPVAVRVTAAARYGEDLHRLADELRARIIDTLGRHTQLTVTSVDVLIDDVYPAREDDR